MHRKALATARSSAVAIVTLTLAVALTCACGPRVRYVYVTTTPSPTPTPTTTPTPTATPTPTPTPTPAPPQALLEPMNHQQQTYNNCGPASIATILAYYGHWVTQYDVNQQIEAGSISGATEYLAGFELMTRAYRFPPSVDPTRYLLANGIPVIVNQRLTTDSDIRHYRIVHGYDNAASEFIADDPLLGASYRISYQDYTRMSYRGIIVPVYPVEMDALVQDLMSDLGLEEGEV